MKIKIFIAGSTDLRREMDLFRSVANKKSVECDMDGIDIVFLAVSCTDFSSMFKDGGQQAMYDAYIEHQADLVFFIFDSKVGEETLKEFKLAYRCFIRENRPKIKVFIKRNDTVDDVVKELASHIKISINQYVVNYDTDDNLISEVDEALTTYIKPYSKNSLSLINVNELWGTLFQAHQYMDGDSSRKEAALKLYRNLVMKSVNNWRYYFSIGVKCASVRIDDFTKVALDAYENARNCSFKEKEELYECKVNVYVGAMKRRLWRLDEALEDITAGYDMLLRLPFSYEERKNALKNLYKVHYLQDNVQQKGYVISQMREFIEGDEVRDIIIELESECDKARKMRCQ